MFKKKPLATLVVANMMLAAHSITPSVVLAEESKENQVETVIVVGERNASTATDLIGSVDVIGQDELAYEHVDDTLELFNKAPGVYLSRYNQGIINTDIAMRGFAGDGASPHAKLLIDGIPSNLHNGYNELDQLFPLNIDSIVVFKGTSDPRYGLFNIAGNYEVQTRRDEAKEVEVTTGSFNTSEAQGYVGLNHGNFSQSYAVGVRDGEGFRDHTELRKMAFSGNWQWDFDETKKLQMSLRHAEYEGDSPGYLSAEQARATPEFSADYANQDGGEKQAQHVSIHWHQTFATQLNWTLRTYAQNFERERWVRFSQAGSISNRYDDQKQMGLITTFSLPLTDTWEIEWGADYESQEVIEQRFGTVGQSRVRDTSNVGRDYDFSFEHFGAFYSLNHQPTDALRWNVAVRADRIIGEFTNVLTEEDRNLYDFETIIQPKFNLVYSATESVNLFANIGRSFQHPFGSSAFTTGDRGARSVSVNDGSEWGAQVQPIDEFTFRVSYWIQTASDEFVDVDGTAKNVGETKRSGFDIALNGEVTDLISYWGSYTSIDSEIVKAATASANTEGNELRSIPEYTASLGLSLNITNSVIARLHLDSKGDYYVNEANQGGQFGGYTSLNLGADYLASWGKVKFQLNNITDQYSEYVYDFSDNASDTIHSPGEGINGHVSISWKL